MRKEQHSPVNSPAAQKPKNSPAYLLLAGLTEPMTAEEEKNSFIRLESYQNKILLLILPNKQVQEHIHTLCREFEQDIVKMEYFCRLWGDSWTDAATYRKQQAFCLQRMRETCFHLERYAQDSAEAKKHSDTAHPTAEKNSSLSQAFSNLCSMGLLSAQIQRLLYVFSDHENHKTAPGIFERLTLLHRNIIDQRQKIVSSNVRLVIPIARKYTRTHLELTDLIQEGCTGLIKAVDQFDVHKGNRFSTYATWWIKHGITRALGEKNRVVRIPLSMQEIMGKIRRVSAEYFAENMRNPEAEELSVLASLSLQKVREALKLLHWSEDADEANDVESISPPTKTGAEESPLYDMVFRAMQANIDQMLSQLESREAEVVKKRYGLGGGIPQTLEEIGQELQISRERVRQLETEAIRKLQKPANLSLLKRNFFD